MRFKDKAEIAKFYNKDNKHSFEAVVSNITRTVATNDDYDDYQAVKYLIILYQKYIALISNTSEKINSIRSNLNELNPSETNNHLINTYKEQLAKAEHTLNVLSARLFGFWKVLKSRDINEQLIELTQMKEYLQLNPDLYLTPVFLPEITVFQLKPHTLEIAARLPITENDEEIVTLDFEQMSANRVCDSDIIFDPSLTSSVQQPVLNLRHNNAEPPSIEPTNKVMRPLL